MVAPRRFPLSVRLQEGQGGEGAAALSDLLPQVPLPISLVENRRVVRRRPGAREAPRRPERLLGRP